MGQMCKLMVAIDEAEKEQAPLLRQFQSGGCKSDVFYQIMMRVVMKKMRGTMPPDFIKQVLHIEYDL